MSDNDLIALGALVFCGVFLVSMCCIMFWVTNKTIEESDADFKKIGL